MQRLQHPLARPLYSGRAFLQPNGFQAEQISAGMFPIGRGDILPIDQVVVRRPANRSGLVPGARVHSHPVFSARQPVVSPSARADSMAQRDKEWSD